MPATKALAKMQYIGQWFLLFSPSDSSHACCLPMHRRVLDWQYIFGEGLCGGSQPPTQADCRVNIVILWLSWYPASTTQMQPLRLPSADTAGWFRTLHIEWILVCFKLKGIFLTLFSPLGDFFPTVAHHSLPAMSWVAVLLESYGHGHVKMFFSWS